VYIVISVNFEGVSCENGSLKQKRLHNVAYVDSAQQAYNYPSKRGSVGPYK